MKQDGLLTLMRSGFALKWRWFLHRASWFERQVRIFLEPGTLAVIVYCLGHWVTDRRLPVVKPLLLPILALAQCAVVLLFGIFIDRRFLVGRGFVIHNFGGLFIPASRAGDNFILYSRRDRGASARRGGTSASLRQQYVPGGWSQVDGGLDRR